MTRTAKTESKTTGKGKPKPIRQELLDELLNEAMVDVVCLDGDFELRESSPQSCWTTIDAG